MMWYLLFFTLCILLLTVKRENYWYNNEVLKLKLTREILLILLCIGLSYASISLHQIKEERFIPLEAGQLTHEIKDVNYVDRSFAGQWDTSSKDYGKVILNLATYIIPISLFLFAGNVKSRAILFFVFTLGYVLTESLTGISKGLIDRYRPFAYISKEDIGSQSNESKEELVEDFMSYDIQNSFFSGDASLTSFGLVFFAFAFTLSYPNHRLGKVVWLLSTAGIILECYFRVQSGKHFPIDVFTGALVGGMIAFGIIRIHTRLSISPINGGGIS